jgi:hypothetical protein
MADLLLGALALGDVARDGRKKRQRAALIPMREHDLGYRNLLAVRTGERRLALPAAA